MSSKSKNQVRIIAGPCSIDEENFSELYEISEISHLSNGTLCKSIYGCRVVGLKSRTSYQPSNDYMGIDHDTAIEAMNMIADGANMNDLPTLPSIQFAKKVAKDTGFLIATEIMLPTLQLYQYANELEGFGFMPWNPSVNQLGWNLKQYELLANSTNLTIGIKNGKWIGCSYDEIDRNLNESLSIIKTWNGLASYAEERVLIHRGFVSDRMSDYRNDPAHQIAAKVKELTGAKVYYDPSHINGPKRQHLILEDTLDALRMKTDDDSEFLYDGILIEVGTSKTDTQQHISISRLQELVDSIATFRSIEVRQDV